MEVRRTCRTVVVFWLFVLCPSLASAAGARSTELVLERVLDSTRFGSPDPAGVYVFPSTGIIVICDSEAEEPPHFQSMNVFVLDPSGELRERHSTLAYSDEPTGIVFVPERGTYFLSDDDARRVFEVDEAFALVSSFSTAAFGCVDPEDVTFAPDRGTLYLVDGHEGRIFEVTPGGGLVSSFSTDGFGLVDPEGIAFDPRSGTLFVVSTASRRIARVTPDGLLVERFEIKSMKMKAPQGLAVVPGEGERDTRLFVADGRRDNVRDGWIAKIRLKGDVCANGVLALEPKADAFVVKGKTTSSVNYGGKRSLVVDRSPATLSYLRFDLTDVPGPIESATLLLSCVDASSRGGRAHVASNEPWDETGITYANRPSVSGNPLSTVAKVAKGNLALFDVTAVVAPGAVVTIAIVGDGTDSAGYGSRESKAGPVLRLSR